MCGVAGVILNSDSPDSALLDKLSAALAHRGPDGQGVHVDGAAALSHTRLAIIDLETGDQPIIGDSGAALIANARADASDPGAR